MSQDLATSAQELYGLAPDQFTAARNARVKQAKAEGERDLAKKLGSLTKPSAAAWVVNMLMRRKPDLMDQMLTLGGSLRQASLDLDSDEVRELSEQRRQLAEAVCKQGSELAAELGHPASPATSDQVYETLHAAMIDADAAAATRTGLLTRSLRASGLGPVDVKAAVAVPDSLGREPAPKGRARLKVVDDGKKAREEAQRELKRAENVASQADKALEKSKLRVEQLTEKRALLLESKNKLLRRLEEANADLKATESQLIEAEDQRDADFADRDIAQGALAEAKSKLSKL